MARLAPHRTALGRAIRARREELGRDLPTLAARMDLDAVTLDRIEAGSVQVGVDRLDCIAAALDLGLEELVRRVQEVRRRQGAAYHEERAGDHRL